MASLIVHFRHQQAIVLNPMSSYLKKNTISSTLMKLLLKILSIKEKFKITHNLTLTDLISYDRGLDVLIYLPLSDLRSEGATVLSSFLRKTKTLFENGFEWWGELPEDRGERGGGDARAMWCAVESPLLQSSSAPPIHLPSHFASEVYSGT